MSPASFFKRTSGWLPAASVLAVVLLGGTRLIMLSAQQHAAEARDAARALAARTGSAIESQLQVLADRANRQAALIARSLTDAGAAADFESVAPGASGFWISADGKTLPFKGSPTAIMEGIAGEWAFATQNQRDVGPSVLGPLRQDSVWIISVLAPVLSSAPGTAQRIAGWSIAYVPLDMILSSIHLGRIVDAGYDFVLKQVEPGDARSRTFANSGAAALADPVTLAVRLPAGFSAAIAGSMLQIELRPRAGWYPRNELAAQIGLVAVLAWLLAFGAHDLSHGLQRLKEALAVSKRRQHALGERLAAEIHLRQELQKSIDHARYHDGFTGLPNRRYLIDQLDRALREMRLKKRRLVGLILVDIARFKIINDTLGHTAGDELMVQAARRFEKASAEAECVLARWGGDQFAVLIPDVPSREVAVALSGVLQESLRAPFQLRRHRLSITAKMGITCTDSGLQRAEDIVREANVALSVAKRQKNARKIMYTTAMGGQAASLVSLEADLHVALANNEFRLLFQPIVDLRTFRMVGAEVLLRWRHPIEGMLSPDKFLAIAEEADLMVPITRRIFLRVCRLAVEWRRSVAENQDFFLSINLSASALRDPGLSDYVAGVLRDTGLSPRALKFELTEAALINNVGAAREVLGGLHRLGIQLMLDDFGTGYSSLNYLQLFPLDYVKIDRPFLSSTGADQANSGILAAIVQMAPSMGLTAVAEMVETEVAALALARMGCALGQGYFFSPPVSSAVALQYLRGEPFKSSVAPIAAEAAAPAAAAAHPSAGSPEDDSPTSILPVGEFAEHEMDSSE